MRCMHDSNALKSIRRRCRPAHCHAIIHPVHCLQAVIFTDGPKRIELSFEAMRGVHGFIHDETGELKHPDVGIFLPIGQAQNALLLTFSYEDDSADHKTLNNEAKKPLLAETPAAPTVAPSKAKNRWGAALAKTQEEVAEKQPALGA